MHRIILVLTVACLVVSCKSQEKTTNIDKDLNELFQLMQGSFNSAEQAKTDSTYYNISLHMFPIWENKGNYLYVEQALTEMQDRPYRQRVYQVERVNDSIFSSIIYKIPNDSLWIGKWKTPAEFDAMSPADLVLRKGCEVLLKRMGTANYKGQTGIGTCESTMRGAAYATSEVVIFQNKIVSWDRGFNAEDEFVWGAEYSGYIFKKKD